MEEEWRPVRGKEEYAEISNLGQIHRFERIIYFGKNHKSKRIQEESWTYGSENSDGYLNANIGSKKFRVNRLVYLTFVGDIPDGMEVNHLDENKHNNRLDNLNLLSHGDNIRYGTGIARSAASRRGKKQSPETIAKKAAAHRGKYNTKCSKAVQALNPKTLAVVMEFPSAHEAQRQYGFDSGCISHCCRNCFNRPGNNVYKGLIWRFKDKK
jgi:hypothetical protein